MIKNDLLIELGFEEIPSSYLKPGIEMWLYSLTKLLKNNDIRYEKTDYYFTPRRYTLYTKGLEEDTEAKTVEITGPPVSIAKTNQGWTKAAAGFAKSQGKSPDDIYFVKKGKNEVCALKIEKREKGIEDIVRDNLVKTVESIRFPKMMIWESSKFKFARPIRWLLAVKDSSVIEGIGFAGIKSSNFTFGNRAYGNKKITVKSTDDYFNVMEENHIVIDQNRRKNIILDKMKNIEEKNGIIIQKDNDLLDEVNGMIEYPVVLLGQFHNQYTELPERVVTTAMKQHQRYFSTANRENKIAPFFIFLANTDQNGTEIINNNEKVLKSRLEDAYFYYDEDLKIPIEKRIEIQKDILWHHDLGTVYEKALRVSDIAGYLMEILNIKFDKQRLKDIALHLKIDLSTNMIKDGKEFTKLEGYIGSIYAKKLGVDEEIADIIMEHNLPRFAKDKLPATDKGAIFALADRYDTITGFISKYGIPKGSRDPLGIRRVANAIIEITANRGWHYDFMAVISKSADKLGGNYNSDKIYDFSIDRIINYVQNENIRYDIINAIAALKLTDIYDIILRSRILHRYRESSENEFNSLVTGQKRVANILKNIELSNNVNPALFREGQEKTLYNDCLKLHEIIESLLSKRDYTGILNEYFKIRPSIDKFFDDVLVMDKNREIKGNRLALMKFLRNLFLKVADFSQIVIEGEK
ncbi:MAG: glycine--tRNA ligase subunit beta [Proteobacteria bacterium]|nr:glycine--tRNA ligase subunit beta [Pseudomonadota bacterium]